ncbi:MAG TPA: CHAT domain-containing protein, partial [Chloroflexaceae bacterium]|nr:CHAT domain-containing protein [Chloroflexaceae bacterium]
IVASPAGLPTLDPDEWETTVTSALTKPIAEGRLSVRTVKRATRKAIRDALLAQGPDIVQFVGHGFYEEGRGRLALVDDDTGGPWALDEERFASLFAGHADGLGLVCLATCESARSDDTQGFVGIAPQLVRRCGVPAVVAMQYRLRADAAKIFLEEFYSSVAARKPVDWAAQAARNAVALELGQDNREFATPVLFMRAADGNVF